MTRDSGIRIIVHGGAGARLGRDYAVEIRHMRALVETGRDRLHAGASALDVVTDTVAGLEASGLYIAGRGSSPNSAGRYELDACVVDGRSRRTGGVAAIEGVASPVRAARRVMECTRHVLLASKGAGEFARRHKLETIETPDTWFAPAGTG